MNPAPVTPKSRTVAEVLRGGMLAALTTCLVACGAPPDQASKLVIYSAGPRPLAEAICAAFTAQTGVATELFTSTTGQILAKLEAEKHRPRADVVILAGNLGAEALKEQGFLLQYRPRGIEASRDPAWHDADGFYHSTGAAALCMAFRADSFVPGLSWADVLEGRFPGKAIMPSPARSGTAADFILTFFQNSPYGTTDKFLEARGHGMEIVGANNQAITSLLIGAHQMVFAAADYLVFARIAAGEPLVVWYPPEGVPLAHRPLAIMASTRHPAAAREFADWYFSDAAQQQVAQVHLIPAMPAAGLSKPRQQAGLSGFMPMDLPAALRMQRPVLRAFQYEVERARLAQ